MHGQNHLNFFHLKQHSAYSLCQIGLFLEEVEAEMTESDWNLLMEEVEVVEVEAKKNWFLVLVLKEQVVEEVEVKILEDQNPQ